ncbi:MAG: hypothetical protein SAK29_40705, partial [Scytonema sp. PMC 1069.18]|nr:hypothetical protein [Scytonema sp. PMC 1069.18]
MIVLTRAIANKPNPDMGIKDDYLRHSQSCSSMTELTKLPKVLPLPAMEAGGVRRFIDGVVSSRMVTITRADDTFGS